MKKYLTIFLLFISLGLFTYEGIYNSQPAIADYSSEYNEHKFYIQKAVAAYVRGINYSNKNCELTSSGVASCFGEVMRGSSVSGATLKDRHRQIWKFDIKNNCKTKGICKIHITNNYHNEKYDIDLWVENGYLTTENPRYQ